MSKIIRGIDGCEKCPKQQYVSWRQDYCCIAVSPFESIKQWRVIPDWCPLEDAEKWNMGDVIENNPQLYKDVEDLTDLKEKAAKWDKLQSFFDTSCAECLLGHICGAHGRSGAICVHIDNALEGKEAGDAER
jgi:ribosomal protein L35AE/L33A